MNMQEPLQKTRRQEVWVCYSQPDTRLLEYFVKTHAHWIVNLTDSWTPLTTDHPSFYPCDLSETYFFQHLWEVSKLWFMSETD